MPNSSPSYGSPVRFTGAALLLALLGCGGDSTGPATLQITTTSLPDAAQAAPYDQTLEASGGEGSLTWSIGAGSLPTGLSLGADGSITGTPLAVLDTFSFAVEVASAGGQTALKVLSITTVPLTFRARGIVNTVSPALSSAFAVGDTFTITYSFDALTPDDDAAATIGEYDALHSVEVRIDTYTCTVDVPSLADGYDLSVANNASNPAFDRYRIDLFERSVNTGQEGSLLGCSAVSGWNVSNQTALFQLYDQPPTALSNDDLPVVPPNPSEFSGGFIAFEFYNPIGCSGSCASAFVSSNVASLTMVPPE